MSNVTCFDTYRRARTQDQAATDFADQLVTRALNANPFMTDALAIVLAQASKIVAYAGDVAPNQGRSVQLCEAARVLHAASSQRFTFLFNALGVRLVFDGDWFYDVYLPAEAQALQSTMESALSAERDYNAAVERANQAGFNQFVNQQLNKPL
jgi:hypothetical protein